MKKVILIASLLVLASCKKEKVEPVATTPVVDCKCGEITYVDWIYVPSTQSQGVNLYVENNCSGNTLIFTKTNDIYSQLLGDTYCHNSAW
tara:strand:- start:48 stop:317 length:270 start_codon:yes stop_codon:yes gene_type:complete